MFQSGHAQAGYVNVCAMKPEAQPNSPPHILVVDDDRQIRAMLARFLHDHGMDVTTAGDGAQMFDAMARETPDLIALDVMLPGENGFALCRRLQGAEQPTPVILLTAMNGETDRVVGLELGADDYIVKPFNPRELLARIRAVLRRTSGMPRSERSNGSPTASRHGHSIPATAA